MGIERMFKNLRTKALKYLTYTLFESPSKLNIIKHQGTDEMNAIADAVDEQIEIFLLKQEVMGLEGTERVSLTTHVERGDSYIFIYDQDSEKCELHVDETAIEFVDDYPVISIPLTNKRQEIYYKERINFESEIINNKYVPDKYINKYQEKLLSALKVEGMHKYLLLGVQYAYRIHNLDLRKWNYKDIHDLTSMFEGLHADTVDISTWTNLEVGGGAYAFHCAEIGELKLPEGENIWNVKYDITGMFRGFKSSRYIEAITRMIDFSNTSDWNEMFAYATDTVNRNCVLKPINISGVGYVQKGQYDFNGMFASTDVEGIDLSESKLLGHGDITTINAMHMFSE